jgi:hypothetical protein
MQCYGVPGSKWLPINTPPENASSDQEIRFVNIRVALAHGIIAGRGVVLTARHLPRGAGIPGDVSSLAAHRAIRGSPSLCASLVFECPLVVMGMGMIGGAVPERHGRHSICTQMRQPSPQLLS